MKLVSYCIPCFNEVDNLPVLYEGLMALVANLPQYDYEIVFSDNASTDGTIDLLRELAASNSRVKVILNTRNFGPARSGKNCCFNASGDVIVTLASDLQTPLELVPVFLEEWEHGNLVVMGQKVDSGEKRQKYLLRNVFYSIIEHNSDIPQYRHITGFSAIDASVYKLIEQYGNYDKSIRFILADLGYPIKLIPYKQPDRSHGRTSYNLSRNLDFSITSLVDTSVKPIRNMVVIGGCLTVLFLVIAIVLTIVAFVTLEPHVAMLGMVSTALFAMCLCVHCIGLVGEYILRVKEQTSSAPIVVERERINLSSNEKDSSANGVI